ncbi:hypothetical protein LX36DRAFT_684925 [Colletotrichum falcatum]|nr:hypothetical protein LX36DRAFT_684925 [Colletotrichum falcatum]
MKNLKRGLRFLPLNLKTVKLFVFVDRLFANNADLTLQLSFIVILANKEIASVDITHAIRTTLALITKRLAIPLIPMVICTDLYLLYECLLYKRHKIHEIQWIYGSDNPADSFTKLSLNSALEALVSDGKVKI